MIPWIVFCLPIFATVLGESPQVEIHDRVEYQEESPGIRIERNSNPQGENEKFFDPKSREYIEEEKKPATFRRGIVDPEVTDQLEGNGWLDVIPGTPGKDYPNYERIPETSFECGDKTPGGYYADIEARCQVFHVCNTGGEKSSFLCPSGSIFNQKYFVCDWWYDFECDDATDLYSLNEKVNRGGTGSGPSGPGRIEETIEYISNEENFSNQEFQSQGNFVSADGFDLSLAGTGEGGPGYVRNGNKKGYQSNVDDEDRREKQNDRNQRRKSFVSQKTTGELSKSNYSSTENKKNERNPNFQSSTEFPRSSEVKEESGASSDVMEGRERFGKENFENSGVNFRYESSNSNGATKTNNFRTGNVRNDHTEQSNRFNENNRDLIERSTPITANNENGNKNKNQNRNEKRNSFGRRSSTGKPQNDYLAPGDVENNYNGGSSSLPQPSSGSDNQEFSNSEEERVSGDQRRSNKNHEFHPNRSPELSSGSNNNEYESSSGTRPANIRGRERTNGGLQSRGLGNGYPSPGRARELPGSDAIVGGITLVNGETFYDNEDQRSSNSQHRSSSFSRKNFYAEKISSDRQNRNLQRSNFRDNRNDSLNDRSFDSNNYEINKRITDQDRQGSENHYANDYLVGVVSGMESSGSNQQRRYLPIL